jgi:hypothetical protein
MNVFGRDQFGHQHYPAFVAAGVSVEEGTSWNLRAGLIRILHPGTGRAG